MELRHLRYFVAAADALNISQAAKHLHVSQPPLSRQIRDLEQELGTALFDRAHKKLRLTPAGQYFLEEARKYFRTRNALPEPRKPLVPGTRGSSRSAS